MLNSLLSKSLAVTVTVTGVKLSLSPRSLNVVPVMLALTIPGGDVATLAAKLSSEAIGVTFVMRTV